MNPPAAPNRAVLLTGPGAAAIAVLRITGPRVPDFLANHFSKPAQPNRCVHGDLHDGDRIIDDPVVVLHDRGADLNLHGGPWVVRATLELLLREGFQEARSSGGVLPVEALDADGVVEAEVEAWLPLARTELAVMTLLAQVDAWKRLAEDPNPDAVRAVLNDLSLWRMLHPPRVAIIGAANVGKSTLANQLFATERSIVADVPGTTRDWVGEFANVDGLPILLVDTPGLRRTPDEIERAAIHRSADQIRAADLLLLVLDATRPLAEQQPLLDQHPTALLILNKTDRPAADSIAALPALRTVASTGQGLDRLRNAIRSAFSISDQTHHPRWWTPRQRAYLATHLADEG